MRWIIKWIFRLVLLVVVLIVAFVFWKDAFLKSVLQERISERTGMEVRIGRFSAGILSPTVDIRDLKLYNPSEFGGTPFLDIPELHLRYDRSDLFYRELHIRLLRLKVAELNVVKNDAGHTNLTNLRWETPARRSATNQPSHTSQAKQSSQFPAVDVLNLSVGRARFVDLKNPAQNREFRPNLQNQIFRNVKSREDLQGILFMIWLRSGGGVPAHLVPP